MVKICLIGIVGVLLAILLKSYKTEYGVYIGVAVCLFLVGNAVGYFSQIIAGIEQLQGYLKDNYRYIMVLLKAVGATYACEFCSGICRDAGYAGIAGQVEIIGKLYLLVIGMPVLFALMESIQTIAR